MLSQSMMPKSVKRFSDDIILPFVDSEPDSDFSPIRLEIIRLQPIRRVLIGAEEIRNFPAPASTYE
jgi:hypothetical protein